MCSLQLQYPVYWDLMEFCDGFRKLLDHLQLDKVSLCFLVLHLFVKQVVGVAGGVIHTGYKLYMLIMLFLFERELEERDMSVLV